MYSRGPTAHATHLLAKNRTPLQVVHASIPLREPVRRQFPANLSRGLDLDIRHYRGEVLDSNTGIKRLARFYVLS